MTKRGRRFGALSPVVQGSAIVAPLAACTSGGGGGNGSTGSGPIPLDDFAARFADALCNDMGPCCEAAGYPHDTAICRETAEAEIKVAIARVKNDGEPYNPDMAGLCVDTVASLVRTCSDKDVAAAFETTCSMVFRETRPPGASCTSSSQCATGAGCKPSPDGGAGECLGPMGVYRGKEGVVCGSTCFRDATYGDLQCVALDPSVPNNNAQCWAEDGIFCDPQSQLCTLSPVLGQPCTSGSPCRDDAFCSNGVCVAKGTSGPCGTFGEACASTAYCDQTTVQCLPCKPRGASCSSGVECSKTDLCDGTCRPMTIASKGSCMGNL